MVQQGGLVLACVSVESVCPRSCAVAAAYSPHSTLHGNRPRVRSYNCQESLNKHQHSPDRVIICVRCRIVEGRVASLRSGGFLLHPLPPTPRVGPVDPVLHAVLRVVEAAHHVLERGALRRQLLSPRRASADDAHLPVVQGKNITCFAIDPPGTWGERDGLEALEAHCCEVGDAIRCAIACRFASAKPALKPAVTPASNPRGGGIQAIGCALLPLTRVRCAASRMALRTARSIGFSLSSGDAGATV